MRHIIKRVVDIVLSLSGILFFLPVFALVSLLIVLDSKGSIFYTQARVGINKQDFLIFKFRTMYPFSEKLGLLTIGENDRRITKVGFWLRRYKIDELPQLFNVLIGNMSIVGPRPEVRKYVELYDNEQLRVLTMKPGITDWASIAYSRENEVLAGAKDPEKFYIQDVMPRKLAYNLTYVNKNSVWKDALIILITIKKIIFN